MRFTYAYAGWPGSRGDSTVLKHSHLYQFAEEYFVPRSYYLVGDSGFPNYHWLITPYGQSACKHRIHGQAARDFNFNHASTRVVIEQAFALLKGRFRCLKLLRCHLKNAPKIMMACVVLHNMCIDGGDTWHAPREQPRPTYDETLGRHAAACRPHVCQHASSRGRRRPRLKRTGMDEGSGRA